MEQETPLVGEDMIFLSMWYLPRFSILYTFNSLGAILFQQWVSHNLPHSCCQLITTGYYSKMNSLLVHILVYFHASLLRKPTGSCTVTLNWSLFISYWGVLGHQNVLCMHTSSKEPRSCFKPVEIIHWI